MFASAPSQITIQDATVAQLDAIGAEYSVNSAVLDVWPTPLAVTVSCETDWQHGKAVCGITDESGEMAELCLACTLPVLIARVSVPDSHTCVDVYQ